MSNKMFPDAAADFASSESLSFASLVCTQDPKQSARVQKQEHDFEFSRSNPGSTIGSPNHYQANKLLLNGQPMTPDRPSQQQVRKQVPLQDFLSQIPGKRKESDKQQSIPNGKQIPQVRRTHVKSKTHQKSFGQKLFCRDCRASEPVPSIKQHKMQ